MKLLILKNQKGGGNGNGNGGDRVAQNYDGKRCKRKRGLNVSEYCWTHGAWNHHSKDCKFKSEGHKDNAAF